MTIQKMRKAHQSRPFKPFTIRTADGREYAVRHPENLAMSPSGRTIVVAEDEETFEHFYLLLVASLHYGNGRAGRRRVR